MIQQPAFCFSGRKNRNMREAVVGVSVVDMLIASVLVVDEWKMSVDKIWLL